jgi:hypothetical protein
MHFGLQRTCAFAQMRQRGPALPDETAMIENLMELCDCASTEYRHDEASEHCSATDLVEDVVMRASRHQVLDPAASPISWSDFCADAPTKRGQYQGLNRKFLLANPASR